MGATRRWLLAAAGLAAIPAVRTHAADDMTVQARRLTGMLNHPESAHRIAAAYLAGTGKTDSRRAALELDMPAVLAPMDRIAGVTASRAFLGARIRADFEAGAVIDVDGWRLSRTEVGACLLVASVV
jgi:hypothetical protein